MTMSAWLNHRWTVPVAAGMMILAAFAIYQLQVSALWGDAAMIGAAIIAGTPVLRRAVAALGARVMGIDLLVSIAAIGAIIITNYWEAAAVTFLFAVGHALEAATLNKTRSALAELVAVAPEVATVLEGEEQREIPAHEVQTGATVLVKNGSRVPVDGIVSAGTGAVDQASITGESIPVAKSVGDQVYAGTIATAGFLKVTATGVGADTTLARIIHRVEEAQDAKAQTARFMDRFSAWYTPAIVVLAGLTAALTYDVTLALTLLVIACPGALVISIPVSVVAGIGRGARDGILIKGGEYLETAAKIDTVAVDKTGTLTQGRPVLTDVIALAPPAASGHPTLPADEVLRMAARAEVGSEHPLARPILEAAAQRGLPVMGLPHHTEPVPGKGIVALLDGHRIAVGNLALIQAENLAGWDDSAAVAAVEQLAEAGRTPMVVACDGVVIGVLGVADQLREDAAAMVQGLRAAGVKDVLMLTGDIAAVGQAVAAEVGIDHVHASLLPEDKLAIVDQLQADGRTVAMVGDGVNDAPALAAADIGVAMGAAGTAVAIETADIALMQDDLLKLPQAISLAKRTIANMRQNIVIALGTVAALMVGVFFSGVTMAVGMLVHELSVLVVIVNAMRLLRSPRRFRRGAGSVLPRQRHERINVTDEDDGARLGGDDARLLQLS